MAILAVQTDPRWASASETVVLADGAPTDLAGLPIESLAELQWHQERQFARQILLSPKGSPERAALIRRAYDAAATIFARRQALAGRPANLGLHPRHVRLVAELVARQHGRRLSPAVFEIGYGRGSLLAGIARLGVPVAGIEVSTVMHQEACRRLGPAHAPCLLRGEFLTADLKRLDGRFSLVYWNDVFEHVPPDEILDYLGRIHRLLASGGQLVTVTPNWHRRPSDVTALFRPPRTKAEGLHLKEYTLVEAWSLLRQAGFRRVATPLAVLPHRIVLAGGGLIRWKRRLEPALELVPFRLARLICRGLCLDCTIAAK
jgi:SAM-dependent methyltransferase